MPLRDQTTGAALFLGRLPFRDTSAVRAEVAGDICRPPEGFDDARCWFHETSCSDYRNVDQGRVGIMATAPWAEFY